MDWICPLGSTSLNGLHVALMIIAYAALRVLLHDGRAAGAARGAGTVARPKTSGRRYSSTEPAGQRWAKRAEMLERMHYSADVVSAKRREKTRRAA
ncbi:MAG: hypothetical protein KBI47_02150 [Armatimonadetes bacterium]|nr:hypothetical protein [Armatimonadota bacterium]MDI9586772.1 hypothetical protein [Acidobacteriota bacterium]